MGFGYWISKTWFKLAGWKTEGDLPQNVPKCVLVAAPHTSNWDLVYSRFGLYILKVPAYYLLKKEWVRFPLKSFFESTGAIGVDRSHSSNLVSDMAELLSRHNEMALMISPEGTRDETGKWKTGFYQIAMQAKVPVVLAFLDYKRKVAGIGPTIFPSGNYAEDMKEIIAFYKTITPRWPEKFVLNN